MDTKEKAIEVCKNLTETINRMTSVHQIESISTAYESTRAKKSTLINQRKRLINQYNLTKKDLE